MHIVEKIVRIGTKKMGSVSEITNVVRAPSLLFYVVLGKHPPSSQSGYNGSFVFS